MTVKVKPGSFWINNYNLIEFGGGSSPKISTPRSGARWIVVSINKLGNINLTSGVIALDSPSFPNINVDDLPLAAIYLNYTNTIITNDMIFDIRPVFSAGGYPVNHNTLISRDVIDCHPMSIQLSYAIRAAYY